MAPILSAVTILTLFLLVSESVTQESTIFSYLIEVEEEQRQDFLELTIKTSAFHESLEQAIIQAQAKASKIKDIQEDLCLSLSKNQKQCRQTSEIGKVQIAAKYETNKKQTVYEGIRATYEVLIKVNNIRIFGPLVDKIVKYEGFIIDKIEWKADEDLIQETFLADSMIKSKQLCGQLGLALNRLISVEEVRQQPEQPEEQEEPAEGEQEEEEEEQPEKEQPEEENTATVYRITVECSKKTKKN